MGGLGGRAVGGLLQTVWCCYWAPSLRRRLACCGNVSVCSPVCAPVLMRAPVIIASTEVLAIATALYSLPLSREYVSAEEGCGSGGTFLSKYGSHCQFKAWRFCFGTQRRMG